MAYQIKSSTFINDSRDLLSTKLNLTPTTASALGSGSEGEIAYVSDANGGKGEVQVRTSAGWKSAFGFPGDGFGSGGTFEETNGGYRYHVFGEGTGTFNWTGGECEILLIGGGGGGGAGRTCGGGGAGGLSVITAYLPAGTHTVSVGSGSAGAAYYPGPYGNAVPNSNGGNTWIMQNSGVYHVKGGGGGWPAKTGGSGAGGNSQASMGGGGSSGPGYVNPGGSGAGGSFPTNPNVAPWLTGSGGGGSESSGQSSPKSSASNGVGGTGHYWNELHTLNPGGPGNAWYYSPTWSPVAPTNNNTYGVCGGGTGGYGNGATPIQPGSGRKGGGGGINQAGLSNGAGGGGGYWNHDANYAGQAGAKGLCIVRYAI